MVIIKHIKPISFPWLFWPIVHLFLVIQWFEGLNYSSRCQCRNIRQRIWGAQSNINDMLISKYKQRRLDIPWVSALDWEIESSGHEASAVESSACFSPLTGHTITFEDHPKTSDAVQKLSNFALEAVRLKGKCIQEKQRFSFCW